jgi:hypothetical protein
VAETEPGLPQRSTAAGFGRVLVVVYAIFAVAATARSVLQIATRFDEAPLAYALSAVAAVVYVVATVALARGDRTSRRVAVVAISVELVGVLTVGALSLLDLTAFPAASVWSGFGCRSWACGGCGGPDPVNGRPTRRARAAAVAPGASAIAARRSARP